VGRDLGNEQGQVAIDLGDLLRQPLDTASDSPQHVGSRTRAAPKQGCFASQLVLGQRGQPVTQRIGRGHHERAELVQRFCTRPHSSPPLDQQEPQLLAPTTSARQAQAFTGDHAACRQGGVDQVVLAAATFVATRPLTLVHQHTLGLEEAHQAGAVAAAPLHPEDRAAKIRRPHQKAPVTSQRRGHSAAVDPGAKPIQRYGDMRPLVRVHPIATVQSVT
jgi:hypothetical protein